MDAKRSRWIAPTNLDHPHIAVDLKCLKADIMVGEREREVESVKRDYGRGTRTHEHIRFQRNKFYQ